jgi:hypothetical protein
VEAFGDDNEDEAFARKLQREYEEDNERYKLKSKGRSGSGEKTQSAKGRTRKKVKYNGMRETDGELFQC